MLKHLVHAYSEKVKMIYIDPPYNTGSDGFVYQDNRKFTPQELARLAGMDEQGKSGTYSFLCGRGRDPTLASRIQVFDSDGRWLQSIGGLGLWGGRFRVAAGIAIAHNGSLFVGDFYNNRIPGTGYLRQRRFNASLMNEIANVSCRLTRSADFPGRGFMHAIIAELFLQLTKELCAYLAQVLPKLSENWCKNMCLLNFQFSSFKSLSNIELSTCWSSG